jgi:hypothetical protein
VRISSLVPTIGERREAAQVAHDDDDLARRFSADLAVAVDDHLRELGEKRLQARETPFS